MLQVVKVCNKKAALLQVAACPFKGARSLNTHPLFCTVSMPCLFFDPGTVTCAIPAIKIWPGELLIVMRHKHNNNSAPHANFRADKLQ